MELNPIEWSEAQKLLLKLVEALTPLVEEQTEAKSIFSLNKRLFIPPEKTLSEEQHFQRSVTLLHAVQKEVTEWVELEPSFSLPKKKEEKTTTVLPEKKESEVPLPKQAQKLIQQVQLTISKLCTSENFKKPQEEPLKEALKRLKPSLDKLIEKVTLGEQFLPSKEVVQTPFKYPVPLPERERLVKQVYVVKKDPEVKARGASREFLPKEEELPVKSENRAKTAPSSEKPKERKEIPHSFIPQQGKKEFIPTFERTTLPINPMIPNPRNPTASSKSKKKRKGFWFTKDDEKERCEE